LGEDRLQESEPAVDVLSIIVGASALLGGAGGMGTVAYWREVRRSRQKTDDSKNVDHQIATALHPVHADIAELHVKLDSVIEHSADTIKIIVSDAMQPVRDQLIALNVKVEPLWTTLIQVGLNQTDVLHQPDPRRAEIDGLLEQLQDELRNGKLMSAGDFLRLRHFLEQIKTYEPGQELPFPVLPAEPTSAAILLAIMGLSRVRRRQGTAA
jgi:hypothetical protein